MEAKNYFDLILKLNFNIKSFICFIKEYQYYTTMELKCTLMVYKVVKFFKHIKYSTKFTTTGYIGVKHQNLRL